MLDHSGHAQDSTQPPDSREGQEMPVEVIDDDAVAGHPIHGLQKLHGRCPVEMVKEEGGVRDVECVGGIGRGEGIPDVDAHLGAKVPRKVAIQVGSGETDDGGVGIETDQFCRAIEGRCSVGKRGEVVPSSTADVKDSDVVTPLEERIQHGRRGRVASEKTIDVPEVGQCVGEKWTSDRGIVHPFLSLQAGRQVWEAGMHGEEKDRVDSRR